MEGAISMTRKRGMTDKIHGWLFAVMCMCMIWLAVRGIFPAWSNVYWTLQSLILGIVFYTVMTFVWRLIKDD